MPNKDNILSISTIAHNGQNLGKCFLYYLKTKRNEQLSEVGYVVVVYAAGAQLPPVVSNYYFI
ncbi:MAG: hypothetical protein V1779_07625 [bacterium]